MEATVYSGVANRVQISGPVAMFPDQMLKGVYNMKPNNRETKIIEVLDLGSGKFFQSWVLS